VYEKMINGGNCIIIAPNWYRIFIQTNYHN